MRPGCAALTRSGKRIRTLEFICSLRKALGKARRWHVEFIAEEPEARTRELAVQSSDVCPLSSQGTHKPLKSCAPKQICFAYLTKKLV